MAKSYFVYIMTNKNNTTLYVGVTGNLQRRVQQHQSGDGGWFTRTYSLDKLVYYEQTNYVVEAISREKQLKAGSRAAKERLIDSVNPAWDDLSDSF